MKAYYWIWLIAVGKDTVSDKYDGVLRVSSDNTIITDLAVHRIYKKIEEYPYKTSVETYSYQKGKYWRDIEQLCQDWFKILEKSSLIRLQKQGNIALSGTVYSWSIVKPGLSK